MIDLKNPGRTIHAGVFLANGVTEVLDIAPVDILCSISKPFLRRLGYLPDHLVAQGIDIEFHWITETGEDGLLTSGIKIKATDSIKTCPPLDIVLMGAHWSGDGSESKQSDIELDFVRRAYQECTAFISICGGMQIPLAAGLLDGKTCTGPRMSLGRLREDHPHVKFVEKRYVNDGKLWTSSTLLNGLDLMRAFVEKIWGGPGTLAETVLRDGAWPTRGVEFRDVD
ncbi:Hypothetical protein D9617_19g102640 [Elsinoe fawcettii]|nr:Hypothetical protein D9617_19g102640 [Elsinoe fawcettii]